MFSVHVLLGALLGCPTLAPGTMFMHTFFRKTQAGILPGQVVVASCLGKARIPTATYRSSQSNAFPQKLCGKAPRTCLRGMQEKEASRKACRKEKALEVTSLTGAVTPRCPPFTYLPDEVLLFNVPGNVPNGIGCLLQKGNNHLLSIFCLPVFLLPWQL